MSNERAPYVSDERIHDIDHKPFPRCTDALEHLRDIYEAHLKEVDELLSLALECVEDDIRACEHKGFMAAAQKFRSLRDRINEHLNR